MFDLFFQFMFVSAPIALSLIIYVIVNIIAYKRKNPRITIREIMERI